MLAIVSVKVLADSSFSMNGYTLRIIDTGSGLVESDYDDHIHVFLDYFPRLHDDYDPTNTSKDITFQFDPNYKGVAQAERDHTTNGNIFLKNWVKFYSGSFDLFGNHFNTNF